MIKPKKRNYANTKWARLFACRRIVLERGKDFSCPSYSMYQQLFNAAYKHGKRIAVTVSADDQTFTVRVLGDRDDA